MRSQHHGQDVSESAPRQVGHRLPDIGFPMAVSRANGNGHAALGKRLGQGQRLFVRMRVVSRVTPHVPVMRGDLLDPISPPAVPAQDPLDETIRLSRAGILLLAASRRRAAESDQEDAVNPSTTSRRAKRIGNVLRTSDLSGSYSCFRVFCHTFPLSIKPDVRLDQTLQLLQRRFGRLARRCWSSPSGPASGGRSACQPPPPNCSRAESDSIAPPDCSRRSGVSL